eukprot:605319-Prymnesium_polylepis.1
MESPTRPPSSRWRRESRTRSSGPTRNPREHAAAARAAGGSRRRKMRMCAVVRMGHRRAAW